MDKDHGQPEPQPTTSGCSNAPNQTETTKKKIKAVTTANNTLVTLDAQSATVTDLQPLTFESGETPMIYRKFNIPYRIRKTETKCRECDEDCENYESLLLHYSIHFLAYQCNKCVKSYMSEVSLNQHKKCHQRSAKHTCYKCKKLFSRSNALKVHIQKCPSKAKEYTRRYFQSVTQDDNCARPYASGANIEHEGIYGEDSTDKSTATTSNNSQTAGTSGTSAESDDKENASTSYDNFSEEDNPPKSKYQCNTCNLSLRNEDELRHHSRTHVEEEDDTDESVENEPVQEEREILVDEEEMNLLMQEEIEREIIMRDDNTFMYIIIDEYYIDDLIYEQTKSD